MIGESLVTFEEDTDYIGFRNKSVESWLSKERFGYHVSDALMCPRQHVYKVLKPRKLTERERELFDYGKAIHKSFENALYFYDPSRFKPEYSIEFKGITGHIDVYDSKNNIPIELKTLQSAWIKEPKTYNIQQLKWYMAILNSITGCLVYYTTTREFKKFWIAMTRTEIEEEKRKLFSEMKKIKSSIKNKAPRLAKAIWSDPSKSWMCERTERYPGCDYVEQCKLIDPRPKETPKY